MYGERVKRERERRGLNPPRSLLLEIISFFPLPYLSSPLSRKNKWCAVWKTTPMIGGIFARSRPRQIKSRFSSNTWYLERRLSRAEATTPLQVFRTRRVENAITIRLSLLDESRVPLIAATLPTDVLIEGVRSRNSARSRSSSIMSASVRAQSSALCACHCSPCHARGWIGMQGYAWQTGKLYYAFLLPRHRCILNPRNAMSQAFHFGDSIFNVDTSQVARVFKRNSGHWQSVSKNFY